jgi:hypothetical protein
MSRRAWLFLYSTRNIAGSLLALLGVGLFLTGVIDHYWLAIVAGLYGVGFLAAPAQSGLALAPEASLSPAEVEGGLRRMLSSIKGRVEPDVQARISSIVGAIGEAMPRLVEGEALFTVRQMAVDYLPSTLDAYVKLPPAYRRLHPVQNGKSAHDVLNDQLTLLDQKMQEILVSVNENDTQALLANGRFLKEKFSTSEFRVA